MSTAEAAAHYIRAGFLPIPIPHRKKHPEISGWQNIRIPLDDVPKYFNGGPQNIAILLGDEYGTADLDLDCAEAIAAANELAPETGMVFGRESKRRSHYFYRSDPALRSRRYVDPSTTRTSSSCDAKRLMEASVYKRLCRPRYTRVASR